MSSSSNCEIVFYLSDEESIEGPLLNQVAQIDQKHFYLPWDFDQWQDAFKKQKRRYLLGLAHKEGKVSSFILLNIDDPDTAHLIKIVVLPDFRRKGIAELLMRYAIDKISKTSTKSLFLEVEQSNFEAIVMYKKLGFKVLVAKNNFYGPLRNAWAMELILQ